MAFPGTQVVFRADRLPWLSLGLVLLGSLVFVATPSPERRGTHDPRAALASAFAFWQAHAYLEVDEGVLAFAEQRFDERSRSVRLAAARELGRRGMPDDAEKRRAEQATLDVLSLAATSVPDEINPLPPGHPLRTFGFTPSSPSAFGAITHVFLHAGWLHFCSIAVMFLVLAASFEQRWGRVSLGAFLLGATLVSAATHGLLESASPMSWFGAAGPVAALFAVFLLRHRMRPVRWALPVYRAGHITLLARELPGASIPALWIVSTLAQILWLEEIGARNDMSVTAVAGGLGFGVFAVALTSAYRHSSRFLAKPGRPQGEATPRTDEAPAPLEDAPIADRIRALLRKGNARDAAALWCQMVEQHPDDRLPADDLVKLVPTLIDRHDAEFACAALRQAVDSRPNEVGVRLALEILDLARDIDPFSALLAARRALAFDELHESKRARVLAQMRELDPASADELELETDSERETEPKLEAPTEELPEASGIEYADPEVTQAPFLQTPPPEITFTPNAVREGSQESETIDLAALPRFDAIRIVSAVPTEVTDDALYFRIGNGRRAKIAHEQVQAVAVAALRDIASKPVVVIDLLLNWTELTEAPLRSIRLRSDQFDPSRVIETAGTPAENLQAFLREIFERTNALPLPDESSAFGRPFRAFKFLRAYQRRVLKVDC